MFSGIPAAKLMVPLLNRSAEGPLTFGVTPAEPAVMNLTFEPVENALFRLIDPVVALPRMIVPAEIDARLPDGITSPVPVPPTSALAQLKCRVVKLG